MRDLYSDDYESVAGDGADRLIPDGVRRLAGAAVFLGLVAALGLWSYRLGTRDAAEVPIIRAMEGPARIEPEEPGGLQARAPGARGERGARRASRRRSRRRTAGQARAGGAGGGGRAAGRAGPRGAGGAGRAGARRGRGPADAARRRVPRISWPFALAEPARLAGGRRTGCRRARGAGRRAGTAAAEPAGEPGGRPRQGGAAPAAGAAGRGGGAGARAGARGVGPAARAPGWCSSAPSTARRSPARPGTSWWRRNGDLLGSKSLYVERTTANARVFYRLRVAGFENTEQTRQMCEALRARGIDCIPVTLQ